jgi:hypothetical protein
MPVPIPDGMSRGFRCAGWEEAVAVNTVTEAPRCMNPDEFRIDRHKGEVPAIWPQKDGYTCGYW